MCGPNHWTDDPESSLFIDAQSAIPMDCERFCETMEEWSGGAGNHGDDRASLLADSRDAPLGDCQRFCEAMDEWM